MNYEFSVASFLFGLLILAFGVIFVRFYQQVADNFGNGVSSYDRYRLYALIACGLGLAVMLNLHSVILNSLADAIFRR